MVFQGECCWMCGSRLSTYVLGKGRNIRFSHAFRISHNLLSLSWWELEGSVERHRVLSLSDAKVHSFWQSQVQDLCFEPAAETMTWVSTFLPLLVFNFLISILPSPLIQIWLLVKYQWANQSISLMRTLYYKTRQLCRLRLNLSVLHLEVRMPVLSTASYCSIGPHC